MNTSNTVMTKWIQVELLSRVALVGLLVLVLLGAMFPPAGAAQIRTMQAAACTSGYALWAGGQARDDVLVISGSSSTINGAAYSNADVRISGSDNRITRSVEYVTLFEDSGDSNNYPAPAQVASANAPLGYAIADYRPGGVAAEAARGAGRYTEVTGDLDVSDPTVLDGLYYVTGDVKLSASEIEGTATIVAEGTIDVSGSNHRLRPYVNGLLLFSNKDDVGAEVIKLAGSDSTLRGVIYGPGGTVELSGSNNTFFGILLGDALKLNGSDLTITFVDEYCEGSPVTPPSDDDDNDTPSEPPAIFIINDSDIRQQVEVVNNITFVNIQINITNTGGDADNIFLVINRDDDDDDRDDDDDGRDDDDDDRDDDDDDRDDDDDGRDDFELVEVDFAEGTGYVHERTTGRIVIGIGLYNVVRRDHTVSVSIKFRLRDDADDDDNDGQIVFAADSSLLYSDSDGTHTVALPALLVPVPVVVPVVVPVTEDVVRLPLERIDTRFRITWEQRGGLAIFGLPLTEARTLSDGTIVQIFERARFEYRAGDILYGRLAAELGYMTAPTVDDDDLDEDDRRWYFAETGHVIGEPFRGFWAERDGLLLFGLPIAGLTTDNDGRPLQCFERVCMQAFPEYSGTPYAVQLRLLGVEFLGQEDDS